LQHVDKQPVYFVQKPCLDSKQLENAWHGKWDVFFIPYHAEKPKRIFKSVCGMVFQHINCWYKKASHFHHVHSQVLLISSLKAFEQNTG
jgi:hypothetical protein